MKIRDTGSTTATNVAAELVLVEVPGCPTVLGIHDILSTRCTVIYLPPEDDGGSPVTGYLLERRSPGLEWTRFNDTPTTELKCVVRNLAPWTRCEFRVAAINEVGTGDFSEPSELITTNAASVPDPLGRPAVVKFAGTSVILEWTAAGDNGEQITSYVISFGVPGTDAAGYSKERFDGQVLTCRLTQLKPKTKYHFAVSAENKLGRGPLSEFSDFVVTYNPSGK